MAAQNSRNREPGRRYGVCSEGTTRSRSLTSRYRPERAARAPDLQEKVSTGFNVSLGTREFVS